MERDLADLAIDEIGRRAERLAARVAAYEIERVADAPLPPDEKAATRAALDLQDALRECRSGFDGADKAHQSAQKALLSEELDHAALGASIEAAERNVAEAKRRLESARAQASDDKFDKRVASTGATARSARTARNSAQSRLGAADIASLRSRLANADSAAERAETHLADNRVQHRDLLIGLDLRGERGLETHLGTACGERDRLAAERRSLESRAAAAKLLHDVFGRHRSEAQQRYRAPYKQHIERFGSLRPCRQRHGGAHANSTRPRRNVRGRFACCPPARRLGSGTASWHNCGYGN